MKKDRKIKGDLIKTYLKGGECPTTTVSMYQSELEKPVSQRVVGEIWEDKNGKKWTKIEGGFVRSYNPDRDAILAERDKVWICKKTGENLKYSHNRLDKITLTKTGMSFDALVEYETELRIKGLYNDYASKKVYLNQLSYLQDLKKKLRESYDYTKEHKVLTYVNSNGFVEEWANESREELMTNIVNDYRLCAKAIRETRNELAKLSHVNIEF